jgi:group II intron reverse transcriptase/maturase
MVLEAVYEQDFRNCSWGFRPRRSAHQALRQIQRGLMEMGGGQVLEVDIKSFFDTLDHGHLRTFLDRRVRDGVLRRMIDKWLKAGVLEKGVLTHHDDGTPQGGVISPLLANVYLHEVLDLWFEDVVRPRMKGSAFLVRYADDFVIAFQSEDDVRRVMNVLSKRFGKYGLTLHPEKTRLVPFERPGWSSLPKGGGGSHRPTTFDLLGFTHYWGRSYKGFWVVKQKTARSRLTRSMKAIRQWCRVNRHLPVAEQQRTLAAKLRGHYQYYGITGNWNSLGLFFSEVHRTWQKWLNRRSQRAQMPWTRFELLLRRYPLPGPVAVHSLQRRDAKPYSKSRMR